MSGKKGEISVNKESLGILPDPMDFSSPCVSLVSQPPPVATQYSDISDSEDFDIPSSQIIQEANRCVFYLCVTNITIVLDL